MKQFPQVLLFSALVAFCTPSAFPSEIVAQIAKEITVKIEGATQGSGVLIDKNGNNYTVLTSWHVLRDQSAEEEIAVFTPDGRIHEGIGEVL